MRTGLERVLKIKEDLLERASRELAALRGEIAVLEERLETTRHELENLSPGETVLGSGDLMMLHGAREVLRHRIRELEERVIRLRDMEPALVDEVTRLYEEKETIRKLHERKLAKLERELQREELKAIDDFALRSSSRQKIDI